MRSVRSALIVAVSVIALLACGVAYADSYRGGGRQGGFSRGDGHQGGFYRDGGRRGGFYGERHHDHYRGDLDLVIGGSIWGWGPWWGYGWPYYDPYYSYYPYYPYPYSPYYYGPSSVLPETPQSYIQREEPESTPASSAWPSDWFYCPGSKTYYPYVKECPGGWQAVPSTPASDGGQVKPSNSSAPSGVWYYCSESKGYYPYIKECPGGWQAVPAEPLSGPKR
jgi:hypothetical protein